ncbi:MAG: lipoate--protein ligase family protein [Lentisphaerae bacterium]|nr:lipoate--protein ligase family protein [Lentisphaerota bacterium]
MLIVNSDSMDVYRNLAIEEYLMERSSGPVLFFWQSDCAVVMGKNQNPWRECRLDLMRAEEVPAARRISGGGAVYHDAGNLNYCVIVDRRSYREEQVYRIVLRALERFGIRAEKTGKSNLSVDGLKFSGNAFCFRKDHALHHGTLLLQTDLNRLNRYLGSMLEGIETHAVASVPAQVMNLQLDRGELILALEEEFRAEYGGDHLIHNSDADLEPAALEPMLRRQNSADWIWGATPQFVLEQSGFRVEVQRGIVTAATGEYADTRWVGKVFQEVAFLLLRCSTVISGIPNQGPVLMRF